MGSLVRMPPKPHEEMKLGKPKRQTNTQKRDDGPQSEPSPPCQIRTLMIAAMPRRQAAALVLIVTTIRRLDRRGLPYGRAPAMLEND